MPVFEILRPGTPRSTLVDVVRRVNDQAMRVRTSPCYAAFNEWCNGMFSDTSHLPFHVGDGARKDITMATQTPSLVRQTFRITVDIETIVTAKPRETLGNGPEDERSHQALVQHLLAHPPVLSQLLRSSAVEALLPAKKLLEAEYGWGRISEQQLLQPLVAELESAAQAYFTEELEDGATVYFFDGYAATIKQVRMTEVGQEGT